MHSLEVLILAGGHSSRMGSPKHLLSLPSGPLYAQLVRVLHEAVPNIRTMHVSIAARSDLDTSLRDGSVSLPPQGTIPSTSITLKLVMDDAEQDIGPAAGLLAAHHHKPAATWLVLACDYPLIEPDAVRQLIESYETPATCFKNAEGFREPLLGIWSPAALRSLVENVASGRSGPAYTLKRLDSKLITPGQETWLTNVNTKQEWEEAKECMHHHSKNG